MKLITYNIHKGIDENNNESLNDIIDYLKRTKADIICLQEVLNSIHIKLLNELDINGYFLSNVKLTNDLYGISIYFKNDMVSVDGVHLVSEKERRGFIHLQLYINDKLVNIINLHLGLSIYERDKQLEQVLNYVDTLRGKNIICGDFNQTDLKIDKFYDLAKIFDLENTETFSKSKSRIDYIFISQNINPTKYIVDFITTSDHFPVIGEFNI